MRRPHKFVIFLWPSQNIWTVWKFTISKIVTSIVKYSQGKPCNKITIGEEYQWHLILQPVSDWKSWSRVCWSNFMNIVQLFFCLEKHKTLKYFNNWNSGEEQLKMGTKGQLISKGLFGVIALTKRPTNFS
jgi:hypothetical protein